MALARSAVRRNHDFIILCHLTTAARLSESRCTLLFISTASSSPAYIGRFAPSPTGPLHFGSLVAAAAGYLDARANHGMWHVRMEDVDTTRCSQRWADEILQTLEVFGFTWDGPVVYQTSPERQQAYGEALRRLCELHQAYPCACSRTQIAEAGILPNIDGELRYPGTCRNGLPPGVEPRAWRVRVTDDSVSFTDRVQGYCEQRLASSIGDFVLRRADGPFAYQLAVVVDDADQGVTDIVRGMDLLASTPRQVYLQHLLHRAQPRYLHVPLVLTAAREKLSKQTGAPALDPDRPGVQLWHALEFLGQQPPADLKTAVPAQVWEWAIPAWNIGAIPKVGAIPCRVSQPPQARSSDPA